MTKRQKVFSFKTIDSCYFNFCWLYRGFKRVSCFWYEDSSEYKRLSECYRCLESFAAIIPKRRSLLNVIAQEPAGFVLVRVGCKFSFFVKIGFLNIESM